MNHRIQNARDRTIIPPSVTPIVELVSLAAPTVAQMASYTLMQFIDTLMLSRVGTNAATAGGNAGLFAFAVISLGVGVLFLVNTLVSQSFGRKQFQDCGRYLWQGIWFSFFAALLFVAVLPFSRSIFTSIGHDKALAGAEGTYLTIVLGASVVKLLGTALGQFLLAIDRPRTVLASTVIGVSINAVAAWALIFGHLGSPRLGIAGAAWGQNIGVGFESAALLFFILQPKTRRTFNVADMRLRWAYLMRLLRVGIPSGIQIVAEVLAWSMFGMWVIGRFGTPAMAAQTYMMRYMVVSFMPAFGVGTAVTALVGRYIGRGRPDIAADRARLGFKLTAVYMVACGIMFYLVRYRLMRLFSDDPAVVSLGATMLIFAAVYQFFDALYIVYSGALRGAGDTVVPAVVTAILCWSITVLGGYLSARYWPGLGPAGPWGLATAYGIILGTFVYLRFARGSWRSIRLEQSPNADTVPAFQAVSG